MSDQRNAEIWSTRLQKELLALTTENASKKETEDVAGVLPAFIQVKKHQLSIENGLCKVLFQISVQKSEGDTKEVTLALDASLSRKADGSIDGAAAVYPFQKPRAFLVAGASSFPEGSTIQDGSPVDIDCDWTPSLHLSDAVLNVGLKMKESILQGEPFFQATGKTGDESVDDLVKGARRFGDFLSKSANNIVQMGQFPNQNRNVRKKKTRKVTTPGEIRIGDEINLVEAPWVDCQGLYSCKAIRRPQFVEDAMELASARVSQKGGTRPTDDSEVPEDFGNFMKMQAGNIGKVAGAGFAGAGAMFRSFTQSAKSVLEESFLMITDTHIIELRSSKLNLSVGTVTFAIPIELMAKLKFRRQESISLFFKPAPDDPLIFMCPDSADAVHQIQSVLKRHGVKGKHTNAATQRAIHEALQIVQEIQAKERALEYKPSVERVNEIMDLYRQAAERFELAGDVRHEEVVTHMRKFLALPLTVGILDGSYKPPPTSEQPTQQQDPSSLPVGEVLERTQAQLEDDDMSMNSSASRRFRAHTSSRTADREFHENIDSMLKEAKQEFEKLQTDDGPDDSKDVGVDPDDSLAAFDAMLHAADKELADIMAS